MTAVYFDTGVLAKLYLEEEHSAAVTRHVTEMSVAIHVTRLHRLELENAVWLKCHRKEIRIGQARLALAAFEDDVACGRVVRQNVDWDEVFTRSTELSRSHTRSIGLRSLDILHVGTALCWGCREIISMDDRQIMAARKCGLRIVDPRRWSKA